MGFCAILQVVVIACPRGEYLVATACAPQSRSGDRRQRPIEASSSTFAKDVNDQPVIRWAVEDAILEQKRTIVGLAGDDFVRCVRKMSPRMWRALHDLRQDDVGCAVVRNG